IDKEDAEPPGIFAALAYGGEEPFLLVMVEEADASRALFLPPKFGQTVNGAHLIGLPQQLAQRRHLSIDGCVAVSAGAKFADQFVEHVLAECAEAPAQKQLVEFAYEEGYIVFVLAGFPQNVAEPVEQFLEAELCDYVQLGAAIGNGISAYCACRPRLRPRCCRLNTMRHDQGLAAMPKRRQQTAPPRRRTDCQTFDLLRDRSKRLS